jgi:quinol monooxygenase YgiN
MSLGGRHRLDTVLIIAGHLAVSPTERDAYVEECMAVVRAAKEAPGCLDYSVTADTVDPSLVRIFELWESEEQLLAFRGAGPSDDQQATIVAADVKRYGVSSVGDP